MLIVTLISSRQRKKRYVVKGQTQNEQLYEKIPNTATLALKSSTCSKELFRQRTNHENNTKFGVYFSFCLFIISLHRRRQSNIIFNSSPVFFLLYFVVGNSLHTLFNIQFIVNLASCSLVLYIQLQFKSNNPQSFEKQLLSEAY